MKKNKLTLLFILGLSIVFTSCKTSKTDNQANKNISNEKALNGLVIEKWESGNIWLKGNYKNNEKDGKFTMYYQSGKTQMEEVFSNGIKNGKHVSYFENGNKEREGEYVDGLQEGSWISYSNNGNIESKIKYRKGEVL